MYKQTHSYNDGNKETAMAVSPLKGASRWVTGGVTGLKWKGLLTNVNVPGKNVRIEVARKWNLQASIVPVYHRCVGVCNTKLKVLH